MKSATGTPLFHIHAAVWRLMGPLPFTVKELSERCGLAESNVRSILANCARDHLAFELPSQPGRWRRAWPRFVCVQDVTQPLPEFASFGPSPAAAIEKWQSEHLPKLAAENLLETNDSIAVAVYHTESMYTLRDGMPRLQIGVVGTLEKRHAALWTGTVDIDTGEPEAVAP